jgi:hypothetical protein
MKREDVLKVDELKAELSDAFRTFERRLTGVFGEVVYALDTVIDRYNALEATQLAQEQRLAAVAERLLQLERRVGPEQ